MPNEQSNPGECRVSDDMGYTYVSGVTFWKKRVDYSVIDGNAIFEGDILLGTAEEMERLRKAFEGELVDVSGPQLEGLMRTGVRFRWPEGVVNFLVDNNLPNRQRVFDAMDHWVQNTNIRFRERTDQQNYVRFVPGNGCGAHVGMCGGVQFIELANGCSTGNTIHEIGHCIGLWHEHSREDREDFVEIVWDNIKRRARHNFEQHIADGDDIYEYDYDSIMHYASHDFAIDRSRPTIISPKPIGQREGLSAGDIRTINTVYPKRTPRH